MKELTMRQFLGRLPAYFVEKIRQHDQNTMNRQTPLIAPLLDIFPSLQLVPKWVPGFKYKQAGSAYSEANESYWNWLKNDLKRQEVRVTTALTFVF